MSPLPAPEAPEPQCPLAPQPPPPIAGNAVRRLLGTAVRVGLAFIGVPLYMRYIGASQWGLLMLFQAAAVPMTLLDLGIGPALVKRVAEARGRGDEEAAVRTVRSALSFAIVTLAVGACALFLLSGWLARSAFAIPATDLETAQRGFRFVALSFAAGVPLAFASNVLAAHQRYDEVLRASSLAIVAGTAAGVAAAGATRDVAIVMLAQAGATAVAAAFASWRAARLLPRRALSPAWDLAEFRGLVGFGGWYTVANAGVLLAQWSDRYVLGAFFPPRTVGFYALAQQMQQIIGSLFSEASDVLFPAVSLRHGMGEVAAARRLALLAGWLLTSAFGPIAVTVGVLGGDFLSLWISSEAGLEAQGVLRLLCAASIVGLAAVAPVFFALGTGHSKWQAPFSLTSGVSALAVSLLLVPSLGIRGVGLGLLAGALVRWTLFVPLWRSLFRVDVSARQFLVHVCAPPLVSLALLAALAPAHDALPHVPTWGTLVAESVLLFATACAVQLFAGEALPGGGERRRAVAGSFRPVAERTWRLFGSGQPR